MARQRQARTRVAVTGLGAVTGFGRGVEELWRALLDERRAMRPAPPSLAGLAVGPLALVESLPLDAPARATTLLRWATDEALADAGFAARGGRVGLCLGTTLGGITGWLRAVRTDEAHGKAAAPPVLDALATGGAPRPVSGSQEESGESGSPTTGFAPAALAAPRRWTWSGPAHALAAEHGLEGPVQVASVACASANVALGLALDQLRSGAAEVVLAGGVDVLHDFVVGGFASLKAVDPELCRPFDRARAGLNLGEGAGLLVLETADHAEARGARVRAWLDGYGNSADAVHMTGPDRQGRGAARAMAAALADAEAALDELAFASLHGTATQFNDLMEARALEQLLGDRAASLPVHSIKGAVGHTLGAAGALEALVCVRMLESGLAPPTAGHLERDPDIPLDIVAGAPRALTLPMVLSTSSGFGGTNAAVVLRRADRPWSART
jgi:3-oxoacyl-[acyl-carrier-protein] synthase II